MYRKAHLYGGLTKNIDVIYAQIKVIYSVKKIFFFSCNKNGKMIQFEAATEQ